MNKHSNGHMNALANNVSMSNLCRAGLKTNGMFWSECCGRRARSQTPEDQNKCGDLEDARPIRYPPQAFILLVPPPPLYFPFQPLHLLAGVLNTLFCHISKNFKACWTRTLGRGSPRWEGLTALGAPRFSRSVPRSRKHHVESLR